MEFHISRAVREAVQVDDVLFSYTGNVIFANVTASRKLAEALNKARGQNADPADTYNAGALFAMGLIDELSHALVAQYRKHTDPAVLSEAVRWFAQQFEPRRLNRLLLTFTEQFPNAEIFRGHITAADWLKRSTDGVSNREAALEELLLLWIANINPAFKPFHALFEDQHLKQQTVYSNVTAAFPEFFSTRPPVGPEVGTLIDALRAPILASPDSLSGQLEYIREKWTPYLGEDLRRILLAIDVLREEDIAIWLRFNPPGPDEFRHGAPQWGNMGFVGDEFVGFDELSRRKYAPGYQAPLDEYEAFSADQAWMPNVVLIAKSTYVWLEQLSKKYKRHIYRLDQIPDEELRLLAARGITGLWLIGLWERSVASRTIKRLRGHHDAVASAYSLKSYDIAEDLGGWLAYNDLKHRAASAGLRLASDMVPNHMGIDSPWVIEHPDWFISRPESPYPSYSFNGPDLSTDPRAEIKIEDHYYDQTDAAVTFRLRHHNSGETRYVYHGNDGTTFAWNDTAQLDYSKAYVREHVIQVILHVARLFPIIRFDAAMVLAKRHVQRLWFPLPGAGGSIPSRAEYAMSQEQFDALMPYEFWREVVDRVAAEVPGTLLLAEAFWLLEGYFVRTLGMHRVYNSAFMNMLRDEENAKYRSYIKKTLEFDPDIMKRYVNFMSNPDERTAIDQFGTGDKYFGVCTLLATLPGLPMFGHGQIEGYTERYGMEFKQARMDEWPDEGLVARHMREIAPLLHRRYIFAGSDNFTLYDFWNGYGHVDENVFAYSNRFEDQRSLVIYNNKYDATRGTIHVSAGFMDKGSGNMRQRSLSEGMSLSTGENVILHFKDQHGLEYLRRATDIHYHGMTFELGGFECVVYVDWHELHSSAEWPWDRLCDQLSGRGVHSVHEELQMLRLRHVHEALREAISPWAVHALAQTADEIAGLVPRETAEASAAEPVTEDPGQDAASPNAPLDTALRLHEIADHSRMFFERICENLSEGGKTPASIADAAIENGGLEPKPGVIRPGAVRRAPTHRNYTECVYAVLTAAARLPQLAVSYTSDWPAKSRPILPMADPSTRQTRVWAPILAWIVLRNLPWRMAPNGDLAELFDRMMLRHALADIFGSFGMEGEARWQAAAEVRLLLSKFSATTDPTRSATFFSDPDARWLAGVNSSEGIAYLQREQFEELLTWIQLPKLIEIARTIEEGSALKSVQRTALNTVEQSVAHALAAAEASGYRLETYLASFTSTRQNPASFPR